MCSYIVFINNIAIIPQILFEKILDPPLLYVGDTQKIIIILAF